MRHRSRLLSLVALLVATPWLGARAAETVFDYRVDRFQVTGQVNFADDFDDGDIVPWTLGIGTRVDTGSELSLRSPGLFMPDFWSFVTGSSSAPGIDVSLARLGVPAFQVSAGSGDFTAVSRWTTLPTAPAGSIGGFYSMSIHMAGPTLPGECIHPPNPTQAPAVARTFTIAMRDFNAVPAPYAGPTGLAMGLNETVVCVFDPSDPTKNQLDIHAPETAAVTLPVTGDVVLRLDWNDVLGRMTPMYSVDGGTSFQTPFASRPYAFSNASFQLLGDSVVATGVPVMDVLGRVLLLAGLITLFGIVAIRLRDARGGRESPADTP